MAELSEREIVALTAAAIGLTQTAAARRLGVRARHLRRAHATAARRLGASNLTHAIALASVAGLLDVGHLRRRSLPPWPMRPGSPVHLALVSALYREAMAAGMPPRRAIAEHFDVTHERAGAWAKLARQKGALTVTCPPGRPRDPS